MAEEMRVVLACKQKKNRNSKFGFLCLIVGILAVSYAAYRGNSEMIYGGIAVIVGGVFHLIGAWRRRLTPKELVIAYEDRLKFFVDAQGGYQELVFSEMSGVSTDSPIGDATETGFVASPATETAGGNLTVTDRRGNAYVVRGVENPALVQDRIRQLLEAAALAETAKRMRGD